MLSDIDLMEHQALKENHPGLYAVIDAAGTAHSKGMKSYLIMMAVRLLELRRVLKDTGSLYLHCDTTASHYLKLTLDSVLGPDNFKNEVIWSYRRWPSKSSKFQTMHDALLFYGKGRENTFNVTYEPPSDSYLKRFKGKTQVLDASGTRKITVDKPTKGMPQRDVWDISIVAGSSKERVGYPTQKPLALLDRIIRASSNEDDIVLDPFCGCATTLVAANRLERQWVGIDLSVKAGELVVERIKEGEGLFGDIQVREDIPKRTDLGPPLTTQERREYKRSALWSASGPLQWL